MVRAVAGIAYLPKFFTRFGLPATARFAHHGGRPWRLSVMNWIGLVLAAALGVYLVVALLFPEKFE
jgi:K+-transporting ATPase KdpF subunit